MSYPEQLWSETTPGLDCLARRGHILVDLRQEGAFRTANGAVPRASWCLWCGGGVSNEDLGVDDE